MPERSERLTWHAPFAALKWAAELAEPSELAELDARRLTPAQVDRLVALAHQVDQSARFE